jgi:hypothetical protein
VPFALSARAACVCMGISVAISVWVGSPATSPRT